MYMLMAQIPYKSCYAAVFSHALPHISYATLLYFLIHFHILPHLCHTILLCVLMHFHTYITLSCCVFSCTSTYTSWGGV